ncbi:MAG: hypothetical protein IJ779_06265 [Ruminococcus sp.]|nr:hypothetical protein [Ruminococcus sp.]
MGKIYKRLTAALVSAVLISGISPLCAFADQPYDSYNYDRWGDAVPSQAGYTTDRTVSGYDLDIGTFSSPSDIFCSHDRLFYIADKGNDRVVVLNEDMTEAVKIYDSFTMPDGSKTKLNKPTGVCVSAENGNIYIADTENSRILIADTDGNVVREITKPDSEIYDSKKTFLPQKVTVDKAGNVYVVLGNITTGAAMFAPDGGFMGFYGANRVEATAERVRNYIRNIFMSEEKRSRRTRSVPTGITNFDIDGDFVFTCTSSSSQTTDTVKKLNAAGKNIFADMEMTFGDFTPMYDTSQNKVLAPAIVDIDIAEDGNINCLDYTTGRVFQYDEDCNLLFITGTLARQTGGFEQVSALESLDGKLYVTDNVKNNITVFKETSFGKAVHKAAALYNEGRYEESLEPWYDVLRRDGNYHRAHVGIASALLRKGDYRGAMKYAKLADAGRTYNKAFEGWRSEFLKAHLGQIIAGIAVFAVLLTAAVRTVRRKRKGKETDGK